MEMNMSKVDERIDGNNCTHGEFVDHLSPAKESHCKDGVKYLEKKLSDWKKTLRSVTFEPKLLISD